MPGARLRCWPASFDREARRLLSLGPPCPLKNLDPHFLSFFSTLISFAAAHYNYQERRNESLGIFAPPRRVNLSFALRISFSRRRGGGTTAMKKAENYSRISRQDVSFKEIWERNNLSRSERSGWTRPRIARCRKSEEKFRQVRFREWEREIVSH